MILFCWLKTLILNFNFDTIFSGMIISGHNYVEQKNGDLICSTCGIRDKFEK